MSMTPDRAAELHQRRIRRSFRLMRILQQQGLSERDATRWPLPCISLSPLHGVRLNLDRDLQHKMQKGHPLRLPFLYPVNLERGLPEQNLT